jgi:hypothetical protein
MTTAWVRLVQPPGERGVQQRVAGSDRADRMREVVAPRVLAQESGGACTDGVVQVLVGVVRGEDQDP